MPDAFPWPRCQIQEVWEPSAPPGDGLTTPGLRHGPPALRAPAYADLVALPARSVLRFVERHLHGLFVATNHRLLLADDHVLVRQGLKTLLEQAGMVVMGEASDGLEALRLAHTHLPEVALLDLAMPHVNGLETARRLRETLPQIKSILLTMHTEEAYVVEALHAGAVGYVVKTQAATDLVEAIHTAVQGAIYVSPLVRSIQKGDRRGSR